MVFFFSISQIQKRNISSSFLSALSSFGFVFARPGRQRSNSSRFKHLSASPVAAQRTHTPSCRRNGCCRYVWGKENKALFDELKQYLCKMSALLTIIKILLIIIVGQNAGWWNNNRCKSYSDYMLQKEICKQNLHCLNTILLKWRLLLLLAMFCFICRMHINHKTFKLDFESSTDWCGNF